MNRSQRTSRPVIALSLAGWAVMAAAAYPLFERPFLRYENLPFPVLNSPVEAGTPAVVHVRRCSTADRPRLYPVSHALDGLNDAPDFHLPASTATAYPGCEEYDRPVPIPAGTPPGRYRLTGTSEPAGFVRTFSVDWETVEFEVIQGAKP